ERVGDVRRKDPRHGVEEEIAGRVLDRPVAPHHVPRHALHRAEAALRGHGAPETVELLARALDAAAHEAVSQRDRVHGAGAGAGYGGDLQPPILEQAIEHAPGEGTVRAATLECDVDLLLFLRL